MVEEEAEHVYHLTILSPEKEVFQDEVYSLIAPGVDGYLEILAHHTPIITLIKPGKLTVIDQQKNKLIFAVTNGILEVSQNRANLLIDAAEPALEIDLDRAQRAYQRAQTRLLSPDQFTDIERAKKALQRAENRIKIFKETHS